MANAQIDSNTFRAIPWHDAELLNIHIELAKDGPAQVRVRCELHPEESRTVLFALGIHSQIIDVYFADAEVTLTLHTTSKREGIDSWEIQETPHHYQLRGNSGSVLDIYSAETWIKEPDESPRM